MLEPMKRETANTGTPARRAKVAYVWRRSYRPRTGAMPAATWAGRQWRRPKTRKSILPPRTFGNRIGLTEAGRRSSASTAFACSGTARVLSLVLVFVILPFANARKAVLHVTR